jgi:hypothetical protein
MMSSASSAPARSRRSGTTRTQHPAATTDSPSAPARNPETPSLVSTVVADRDLSHEDIARLAYALWEARGGQGGSPEDDWLSAEQKLRRRVSEVS